MNSSPISALGVVFVVILLFTISTINFFLIEMLELFKFIFDIFVFGSFVNRDLSDDLSRFVFRIDKSTTSIFDVGRDPSKTPVTDVIEEISIEFSNTCVTLAALF